MSIDRNGTSYIGGMYVEIDRNAYENQGVIENVNVPVTGESLYEQMLEEDHGTSNYDNLSGGYGYDIISPRELGNLLKLAGGKRGAVVGYLLNKRNIGNTFRVTMKTIAKATGASMPTVNNAVRDLKAAGLIKKGLNCEYMVSPRLVYRGKFSRAAYLWKCYEKFDQFCHESENDKGEKVDEWDENEADIV